MKPEDVLYKEWMRARRLRDKHRGAQGQAYYAMADHLQYLLEDFSPYGRSLVWSGARTRR